MNGETSDRPFAELPAALVEEILERTDGLSQKLLSEFEQTRTCRQEWRAQLAESGLLSRDAEFPYVPIPTTCGVDGSYAIERLLASDLAAAAAVAVEGLTPPSETRYWPEPRHLVWIEAEPHESETGTILRALMIGLELELAVRAPHQVVLLDGSLTTPLIHFNQALNQVGKVPHLQVAQELLRRMPEFLKAYHTVLASIRSDRCYVAVPKYTTHREIGSALGWPEAHDDRGLLSLLLEPGEFTRPQVLEEPRAPWHLNVGPLSSAEDAVRLAEDIIGLLKEIRVVYYRPYPWLPALRLEMARSAAENSALLATILHGVRYQCGAPAVMEPYPLYMADRMVKHLPRAIPTFRQVTTQRLTETYEGNIDEIFLGLHGYRTEGGA